MTDERPRFVLHVDWDDPRIIRTGDTSFFMLPDPAPAGATTPGPLGPEWQPVGFTTDEPTFTAAPDWDYCGQCNQPLLRGMHPAGSFCSHA